MAQTTRFGFDKFGGPYGGAITDDGSKYSTTDRDAFDKILAFFEDHKHDGGSSPVALANPTVAATETTSTTGGTIPRGVTRYYKYTLVDQFGMETVGSPELAVTLPGTISVTVPPVTTGSNGVSSTLAQGTYYYALTGNTADGETLLGPEAVITVQAGQNQVDLVLPALPSGVTSWNVWRMGVTEQGWTKVFDSQPAGTYTDIGYASGDCLCDPSTQPPTTDLVASGTYSITITPDPTALATAVSWKLYESDTSGSYSSPSLVASVVPTVIGDPPPANYVDTGSALLAGQPPLVSQTLKPSHAVSGGSGGGGSDSHYVTDTQYQVLPVTSGDQKPVYFEGATPDVVGFDIVPVYEPSSDTLGDELQIDTDAVYGFYGRMFVDGVVAGDQFQIIMNWDAGGPGSLGFLPAVLGTLVVPPGLTSAFGTFMLPPIFIPKGTRVSFSLNSFFTGSAPTTVQASVGCSMASGTPAAAEVYPAVAGLAAVIAGPSGFDVSWTTAVTDVGYDVLYYDRAAAAPTPVVKHTTTSGTDTVTGLIVGHSYDVIVLAHKNIGGVLTYSTPAIVNASLYPTPGYFADNFNRADGALTMPDWITGLGDPAGVMAVSTNALANTGTGGVAYALHNLATQAKWITFDHAAPASGAAVVMVLASDFAMGNPRCLLTIDPTAVTAPTIDYYDGSGTHTAVTMTAVGAGLTAYAGSTATLRGTIHDDQVMLYQGGTLVAIGVIPAAITNTVAGGVGLHPASSNGGTIDNFEIAVYHSVSSAGPGGSQAFSAGGVTYAAELLPVDDATAGRIGIVAIYGKQSVPTLDGFTQLFEQHDGTGYLSLWHKVFAGTEGGGLQVYAQAAPFVGVMKSYVAGLPTVTGSGATGDVTPTETVAIGDAIFSVVGSVTAAATNFTGADDPNTGGWNDIVSTDSTLTLMCADEDSALTGTSHARTITSGGTSPTYSAATVVLAP